MELVWDEAKRKINLDKHGLDFADAARFKWRAALIVEDLRQGYGEQRFLALGPIDGRLVSLAFTRRGRKLRIISLRGASRKERRSYAQAQDI